MTNVPMSPEVSEGLMRLLSSGIAVRYALHLQKSGGQRFGGEVLLYSARDDKYAVWVMTAFNVGSFLGVREQSVQLSQGGIFTADTAARKTVDQALAGWEKKIELEDASVSWCASDSFVGTVHYENGLIRRLPRSSPLFLLYHGLILSYVERLFRDFFQVNSGDPENRQQCRAYELLHRRFSAFVAQSQLEFASLV